MIVKLIHSLFCAAITIMVGDKTIEELEREVAEAERLANEAKLRAKQLREQVKDAKRRSASSGY
jgi:F0F1-type ATP synthase membrane subunit b/b'